MRLFGSRFCSFARILALPRQLFSYVARLNRLFSSEGHHFHGHAELATRMRSRAVAAMAATFGSRFFRVL